MLLAWQWLLEAHLKAHLALPLALRMLLRGYLAPTAWLDTDGDEGLDVLSARTDWLRITSVGTSTLPERGAIHGLARVWDFARMAVAVVAYIVGKNTPANAVGYLGFRWL